MDPTVTETKYVRKLLLQSLNLYNFNALKHTLFGLQLLINQLIVKSIKCDEIEQNGH